MIDDLKPYPEYRDSGLPWLGKVPAHWRVVRNGSLFRQRNQTGFAELPILEVSLRTGVRVRDFETSKRKQVMSDFAKYKRAAAGDIAYNMMRMWQGAVGIAPVDGLVSPAYVVAAPFDAVEPRYFNELFRTAAYMAEVDNCSRGIVKDRNRLYWDQFKTLMSPCPPPDEQAAIVRFVGWVTGQVDRAILAKRKVIALLNEQKQIVVHNAVTGGLDPKLPRKLSGIEWVGDIPKHWSVHRSKYIFREVDERSVRGDETHLSMSQKFGLVPNSTLNEKRLVSASYAGAKLCKPGDLVLNRLKAHLGVFAIAPEAGLVSPDYTVFRAVRDIEARYFEAVYRTPACRIELRQRAKGIVQGFWRLYTDDFYDIRVPVPPLDEQRRIMNRLDIELSTLNASVLRFAREADLLVEYRAKLIAECVTGQLDIRPLVRDLPDVTDLPPIVTAIGEGEIDTEDEEFAA